MAKYDNVYVPLEGEDGNAFFILVRVTRAMKLAGISEEEREAYKSEATSGDYDNLIRVTTEWVNVG